MLRSAVRVRVGLALIIGLLFCTLGTLELPELVNLTDNTSNDYSTSVFQEQKASSVKKRKQVPDVTLQAVSPQPKGEWQKAWQIRYAQSVCAAQSDSLHLFCILRT
jgi:hypothetical protein